MTATLATDHRVTQSCADSELRRNEAFPRWSEHVYGGVMPQRGGKSRPPTPLMKYLKSIQDRPGWSIARVARESGGRVSRATLFRIMTGETKRVSVDTVRLVAQIAGDDPDEVLAMAAGSISVLSDRDTRLDGLDPNDNVVRTILALDISAERKARMLDRRRKILADRERADLEEIEFLVDPGADAV
jgi:transcriptional regulator with XRE-family HTH domain